MDEIKFSFEGVTIFFKNRGDGVLTIIIEDDDKWQNAVCKLSSDKVARLRKFLNQSGV